MPAKKRMAPLFCQPHPFHALVSSPRHFRGRAFHFQYSTEGHRCPSARVPSWGKGHQEGLIPGIRVLLLGILISHKVISRGLVLCRASQQALDFFRKTKHKKSHMSEIKDLKRRREDDAGNNTEHREADAVPVRSPRRG